MKKDNMKKILKKSITAVLIIAMMAILITFHIQTNTKFNKILQVNLDQIYQSLLAVDNEDIKFFEKDIDKFSTSCYSATKTICAIENSDYNLDDFYFFLLYLRDFKNYNLEKKEKIIEALQLMNEEFYRVSWHTTKGLGINVYYDFILKDPNKIKELTLKLNMISKSAIN